MNVARPVEHNRNVDSGVFPADDDLWGRLLHRASKQEGVKWKKRVAEGGPSLLHYADGGWKVLDLSRGSGRSKRPDGT